MHKFLNFSKIISLVLASTLLAACGGGGDTASAASAPISCVVPIASKNTVTFDTTGMTAICGNIYVDPSVASTAHAGIATGYKNAIDTNKAFYGTLLLTNPDVVACDYTRTNCANFFTGSTLRNRILSPGSRAGTYTAPRWTVALVSATSSANQNITAHELSHLELAARLQNRGVPAWFNEGLATYIGNEPACAGVAGRGIQDLTLLATGTQWETHTNTLSLLVPTYCQARNEVAAWITRFGKPAMLQLITDVAGGQSFSVKYGALQTQ